MTQPTHKLIVASPRGFCAGVERAISIVNHMLEEIEGPLYVRKEIVHNKAVVDDFSERGVVFVEELDEVPKNSTVIFSAHGISPEVRDQAYQRGLTVVDATCPLVTKVHNQVVNKAAHGYQVILIGHRGHDEVVGTMGEAPDSITLVTHVDDVHNLDIPIDVPLYYVTQTTLSVDETSSIVDALKARFPNLQGPSKSDICYATQNRQDGVKELVSMGIEYLLVVGSQNSSNSRRLCEVAQKAGVPAALIESVEELPDRMCVGLTAGASAPEYLVNTIVAHFRAMQWEIDEHVVMEEDIKFELPIDLRR
jgi:4-hydroxy-3-methylbut-2-en-1-yl diphosphate reductase